MSIFPGMQPQGTSQTEVRAFEGTIASHLRRGSWLLLAFSAAALAALLLIFYFLWQHRPEAGYSAGDIAISAILALMCICNIVRAVLRIAEPRRHPFYQWLRKFGDANELMQQIERESAGGSRKLGRAWFTRNWILNETPFGLSGMRVDDIVWIYTDWELMSVPGVPIVHHVPVGRNFTCVIWDRHGRQFQVRASRPNVEQLERALAAWVPWSFVGNNPQLRRRWWWASKEFLREVDQRRAAMSR